MLTRFLDAIASARTIGHRTDALRLLACGVLLAAVPVTAQSWPYNMRFVAPYVDVQVDNMTGAPLLLLGVVTDGCSMDSRETYMVVAESERGWPVGYRVRLHARYLLWADTRPETRGLYAYIDWDGWFGGFGVGNYQPPLAVQTWRRGEAWTTAHWDLGSGAFWAHYCEDAMCGWTTPCQQQGKHYTVPQVALLACELELY